jgi:hypothetical protein
MNFKHGVKYSIDGVVRIFMVADEIWRDLGAELVVTSLMEGEHRNGSKHYVGDAADLRSRYFSEEKKLQAVRRLRASLGDDYDVVVHSTHIHCEYDKK